ncbi:MAG: J domain-containing protein [Pseudomonadota bacterium]
MFNSADKKISILATLTLSDGRELTGKVILGASSDLTRTLNGESLFLEFETHAGVRSMIAKGSIVEIQEINVPKARKLNCGTDLSGFDPHEVLGLSSTASKKQVRSAYLDLAKQYHPDRFASMELPEEVVAYLDAKSRRVNSAYALLSAPSSSTIAETGS